MRVLLGVTGGIAAYKVALVARRLKEDGHAVRVIPTEASLNFVGRATWEALTGEPARSGTFENVPAVEHIMLGQRADIVLVAPATADFLASMAAGEARDLLGNALLATTAPVVVAPAMHTEMWRHPATAANVATLLARGVHVIEPDSGRLTGSDTGPGRLPEPDDLVAALYAVAQSSQIAPTPSSGTDSSWGDLGGVSIVISAGGTREPIDAVRFLGNRSSGHQGFVLAEAARERGAQVTVVAANVALPLGEGVARVDVETSAQLADAMREAAIDADAVIMAAAVADYRPASTSANKIKKNGASLTLELTETEDILASLVAAKPPGQVIVGFAAETGDDAGSVLDYGRAKARRKKADLLVVNEVGHGVGFGDVANAVSMLDADGALVAEASGTKLSVAHAVLDQVAERVKR
ncbi:bifunctional phosphopantothenoylcysteine decarboxylase/phosphopantothenate--cysteine ligase CoaBC [Demequina sp. TTPB684]|uniref:bifunctional phosphopantothenoylcysteine decarboxylase/phosphopantothenate--cysteine ligase CoaBC n=1 Tax=unclassified Demequina TaxID=2620311 RepID=UPI001CF37984|nr:MULTISPECIES: bifunctional phosphopantothenoylcysteine decarboxylase/phosphopantothenate--cysteine ligase CoaBC [unclassified Demequina]MCB2413096.1 bifunctional phosphopantothenoylcysteine decarboxylase/phosphopantothenate--cysteine ligase CoaBC [Demequina sp. TTPB684]UPU89259.1 bifunctional phosphopantothenoylcysteine decarboxylase/phosphopantothenate--cysteine ligase CoaBC [Demequina sp. TMPB413]